MYWFFTPERFNTLYDSVYDTLKGNEDAEQFYIKVIGEDNGDDMDAGVCSGGWGVELLLPNSKVKLNIPITDGGEKAYTKPPVNFLDYKVIPTTADKLNVVDTELEFTKINWHEK